MNTAIVINLDYQHLPEQTAQRIWKEIDRTLVDAGFTRNNRLFLSPLSPEAASQRVRAVMVQLEARLATEGLSLYGALADFYAMDYLHTENLLVPPTASIEVTELPAAGKLDQPPPQ